MHFQNLQCYFSPGFLAEGRRGRTTNLENEQQKLENAFSQIIMSFFTRIFRRGRTKKLENMNMGINMVYIN